MITCGTLDSSLEPISQRVTVEVTLFLFPTISLSSNFIAELLSDAIEEPEEEDTQKTQQSTSTQQNNISETPTVANFKEEYQITRQVDDDGNVVVKVPLEVDLTVNSGISYDATLENGDAS